MFRPVQADPAPELVRRITFVPFLPDGRCVLIETADGHLYAWIEGDRYTGERARSTPELAIDTAERAAAGLRACGQAAAAVTAAAASYRGQTDDCYYADSLRTLERAFLRGRTAQEGSGFGGDERQWRLARHHIAAAITADGTFLDVGCANGLLMESVAAWCAERGLTVQPYGVDLGAGLVAEARRRLPRWAARIDARPS